jgi:hypothetical protein
MIDENKTVEEYTDYKNEMLLQTNSFIKIRQWIKENLEDLNKENWSTFIQSMAYLHPQAYGPYIQKKLIEDLNLTKIKSSDDKGDFLDQFGDHYELKVSLITDCFQKINLVQIRPWQKTNYYFIAFVLNEKGVHAYCFKLSHQEMKNEIELTNMGAAHGTKNAIIENKNIELRISIPIDVNNDIFCRWFENYRSGLFDNKVDVISPKSLDDVKKMYE